MDLHLREQQWGHLPWCRFVRVSISVDSVRLSGLYISLINITEVISLASSQFAGPQVAIAGYTPNHAAYGKQRAKVVGLTGTYAQYVVVKFQMHVLKPQGKAGTVLLGVSILLRRGSGLD